MNRPPRLLYLVTEDWYFCSHRLPLALAARQAGFAVSVLTRVGEHGGQIEAAGLNLFPLQLSRGGRHPLRELRAIRDIASLYHELQPDIVHHVALKPVLYGSVAARWEKVPAVVNAVAGLGYIFTSRDFAARALRPLIRGAYGALLDAAHSRLIVQNPDDLALFADSGMVERSRIALIPGSGVDLQRFQPTPEPDGRPLVMLPARLLRDKGVEEFVAAARQLKREGLDARFALVGVPDADNPASIPADRLEAWRLAGLVECWGWRDDMAAVFSQCHVACLPSYREGLPKSLIEAAACARPIVTCNVPGCRDVVRDGDNGLLVPPRDAVALAAALKRLILDPGLRLRMGARGRERAAAEFSIERVVRETLALYRRLLPS